MRHKWDMAKKRIALALVAASLLGTLVGLAGCGLHQANTYIDWVNFIRFGGITYLASYDPGREIQQADIGPQFATVRHRLSASANANDPNYQTEDGVAAYLDVGTPIYRVNGYASTFRLAARQSGHYVFFEVDINPHARTGADLLDIGGRVRSITVTDDSGTSAKTLTTFSAARQVTSLVALLLGAPVDQTREAGAGARYTLTFTLADGTQVARSYFPQAHLVERGIIAPDAFVSTLAAASGT